MNNDATMNIYVYVDFHKLSFTDFFLIFKYMYIKMYIVFCSKNMHIKNLKYRKEYNSHYPWAA